MSNELISYDISSNLDRVINDDCYKTLNELPTESIDVIITSPPYFQQRNYGLGIGNEDTCEKYINDLVDIFELCVKVLKKTGSIFINIGDKYQDSSLLLIPYAFAKEALNRTEVKLINEITWVKSNPEPRQFQRRLVSSTEPFFHFAKSNKYQYYRDNFMSQGESLRPKKKNGDNIGKSYFKLIETSDLSSEQKLLAKEELEEVINEVKQGKISSLRMKIRGIHSAAYGGYEGGRKQHIEKKGFTIIRMPGRSLKRDVIESPILQQKFLNHPAIYPEFLVQELLNLTTKEDDIVLDPFLGSGTTAVVAKRMKRHYIGIEINQEYCKLANKRLEETIVQPTLTEFYI